MSRSAPFVKPVTLRRMARKGRTALACSIVALLSACGGGDRAEPYQPDRVVVFGDDNSAFAPDEPVGSGVIEGLVYSVNFLLPVSQVYCSDTASASSACALDGDGRTDQPFSMTDFEATDDTRPWGTGFFLTPESGQRLTQNAVRLLAVGTGAYDADNDAATASIANTATKQDRRVHYACSSDIIAAQHIAHEFGKGFSDNCGLDRSGARTFAGADGTVATLQAQVNAAQAEGLLREGSLTMVWIGQNDIVEIAEDTTTYVTLDAKLYEVKVRAERLAQVVKQIYNSGAKVVLIGVTDLGFSPWARSLIGSQTASCSNTERSDKTQINGCNGDVQKLVHAFNDTLQLGDKATGFKGLKDLSFSGRHYTFIDAADILASYALNSGYKNDRLCPVTQDLTALATLPSVKPDGTRVSFSDVSAEVLEVQYCTSETLVTGGSVSTYLWADGQRLAWPVHEAIANAALVRVVNQF